MRMKAFIAGIIAAAFAHGAAANGMDHPQPARPAAEQQVLLRDQILSAFDAVRGKIVRADELQAAFNSASEKNMGFAERMMAQAKISGFMKSEKQRNGVIRHDDGKGNVTVYVEAEALRAFMVRDLDRGKIPGALESTLLRISNTTAEALKKIPDHRAALKPPA